MRRRGGASGQPVKGRRHSTVRPKARKAPTAHVSIADLQEQLDCRTRDLDEALEQQTATAEILSVISNSPSDTQPVFDAIVQSGLKLFPNGGLSVCCSALVAIGTKRTCQPIRRMSAFGSKADTRSSVSVSSILPVGAMQRHQL